MKLRFTTTLVCSLIMAFGLQAQITLDPCIENTDFKIVVLGSSTAAGSGASSTDSSWVGKYRNRIQQINPNNQVINLAVGGFTTYRIMPDSFVAPANRPAVDTLKNITRALSLNPDAIIVNLPSNDRSWPMNEQLSNFDSLYNHSWNNGVPIYICTTQPIMPIASASYQRAVRDSIVSQFAPYFIEFFLPIADTNNTVISAYAKDAVHLNDTGHNILYNQVVNKDILIDIFEPSNFPDLSVRGVVYNSQCADSLKSIGWVVSNIGDTITPGIIGYATSELNGVKDSVQLALSNSLLPCQTDTLWTNHNLHIPGNYNLKVVVTVVADSNIANNTFASEIETVVAPIISTVTDTVCKGQSAAFSAQLLQGDTLLWYASVIDSTPISTLSTISNLQKDTMLFAQGVSGNLHFNRTLISTENSNINFNGNMFDLVADTNLTLTEFEIRVLDVGNIPYWIYTKSGSYKGSENTAVNWTLLKQDSVQVNASGEFVSLDMLNTVMSAGDTLGVYIHLNSPSRLQYQSMSLPLSKSTNELTYLSGSGVAHTFGSVYPNRVLNLKLNYEFGFNPLGSCTTTRTPVSISISKEKLDLGPDDYLPLTGSVIILPNNFTNPVWINAGNSDTLSTSNNVFIDSTQITQQNKVYLICFAEDKWGCLTQDTVVYTLVDNIGIAESEKLKVLFSPNPTTGEVKIESTTILEEIWVYDFCGRVVEQIILNQNAVNVNLENSPNGIYMILVQTKEGLFTEKIVKH